MKFSDKVRSVYRLWVNSGCPRIFSFHDCLPDIFSEYLECLLLKRCRTLGSQELLEAVKSRRGSRADVALTFDDGRRNLWTVIFPLLKKYRMKAIFFIIPSRLSTSTESHPSLEDYWKGKVSWENLYSSHLKFPYLSWQEVKTMVASGLVDIGSHGQRHDIVYSGSGVIDFQHPGVYEMPVYFDHWYNAGQPALEDVWGCPVYEQSWAALVSNSYSSSGEAEKIMRDFVKLRGGYLFFKTRKWRRILRDYFRKHASQVVRGEFHRIDRPETVQESIAESKTWIERQLGCSCRIFSLPLAQSNLDVGRSLEGAGYEAAVCGYGPLSLRGIRSTVSFLPRIPGHWLNYYDIF